MPNSSHGAADSADFVLGMIKQQICSWAALISQGSKPWHALLCEWCWTCATQLGGEHKFPCSAPEVSACDHLQPRAVSLVCRTKSATGLFLQNMCYYCSGVYTCQSHKSFPIIFLQLEQENRHDLSGIYIHWAWQRSASSCSILGCTGHRESIVTTWKKFYRLFLTALQFVLSFINININGFHTGL